MLSYNLHTFGCKVNTYDSGLLEKRLSHAGFSLSSTSAPVHILNTCAVTAEATREAVRQIRRLKAKDPLCLVVVTGCAAQVDTDQFADLTAADLIVANSHKGELETIIHNFLRGDRSQRVFKSNIFKKTDLEEGGGLEANHTRSFLKIQDGCNSFCTFCVIPFARGKSRSLSIDHLTRKVQELHGMGVKEVVLTGVHIGDYRDETREQDHHLEDLVETLLKQTAIERIRLTSLEPIEISERLLELYQDPRMCRHFHMSIQSAQSKVLRDMKRRYGHKEVEQSLNTIARRVPNAFVGMDVIAGFPGETHDEFVETYERLAALPWTRLHVFPYSSRPGTYANRLPDHLDRALVLRRAGQLRRLSSERFEQEARGQLKTIKRVLILKAGEQGDVQALSRDYWPVKLSHGKWSMQIGQEIDVVVTGYEEPPPSKMQGQLLATPPGGVGL